MQLSYGTYSFPVNGVKTESRFRIIQSDTGRPIRYVQSIDVTAYIDGSGQADLTSKEVALNAALLKPYQSLTLHQDSGTATGVNLVNQNSISGVRITDGPSYTNESQDGEYVVQRVCRFTGEAEFVITSTATAVISFSETVSIIGNGGPITRWRQMINTNPIPQIVYPSSTTKATQSGNAVGHAGYPNVPPPLWPLVELNDRRVIKRGNPRRLGSGFIEYPISWTYEFETLGPLIGLPSRPPM